MDERWRPFTQERNTNLKNVILIFFPLLDRVWCFYCILICRHLVLIITIFCQIVSGVRLPSSICCNACNNVVGPTDYTKTSLTCNLVAKIFPIFLSQALQPIIINTETLFCSTQCQTCGYLMHLKALICMLKQSYLHLSHLPC